MYVCIYVNLFFNWKTAITTKTDPLDFIAQDGFIYIHL